MVSLIGALYSSWILVQRRPAIYLDKHAGMLCLENASFPIRKTIIPFCKMERVELEYEPDTTHRILIIHYLNERNRHATFRYLLGNVNVDPKILLRVIENQHREEIKG